MDRNVTTEAVAAFKRLFPNLPTYKWVVPEMYITGFGFIDGVPEMVMEPALYKVQQRLDEGWKLDANNDWEFVGL